MRRLDAVVCCGVLLLAACSPSSPSLPQSCVGDGVHSFTMDCWIHGQRGVIQLDTRWQPECILRVDARVDGQFIGTARNGGRLYWDSRTAPDGEHVVTFEAPGWAAAVCPLRTDNTPPRVLSCVPRRTTWGEFGIRVGIDLLFDEPVYPGEYPPPPYVGADYTAWHWVIPVPDKSVLPAHLAVDLAYWGDWVGNDPVPFDCGADYAAWLSPWGEGPIPGLEGAGRSLFSAWLTENEPGGEMIRIEPGGRLQWLTTVAPEPWVFQRTLESSETSRASQLTGNFWLETAADGTQAVRALQQRRETFDWVNNFVAPLDPSRAPFVLQRAGYFSAAWTERGDDGRRVGRVAVDLSKYFGDWLVLPPIVASPGMEVRELHATWYNPGVMACYVEAEPGGPGLVRAVWPNESWEWVDISKHILNRDPAHSASEPSLQWDGAARILAAWVEDGQVLASVDDWWNPEFGPPEVLNRDPAARARSPRILLPWNRVVFVEEGPAGDRFEARQPDEADYAWRAWSPIETGGHVVDFDVNRDTAVTIVWSDDAGQVRIRVFNE